MAERITVDVTGLTHEGYGVAKVEGFTYFIPGALMGERIVCDISRREKNYGYADLKEILTPSKYRVTPPCPIFGDCGGCDIMHLDYSKQLEFKKQMVESTFQRIGHLNLMVDEMIGMENPYYYRNKVQVPFGTRHQKVVCGYYRRKTHDIIPLKSCHIQSDEMTAILVAIKDLMNEFKVSSYDEVHHTGCLRHVMVRRNRKQQYMIVFITYEDKMKGIGEIIHRLTSLFPSIVSIIQNMNHKTTNVILGSLSRVVYGEEYLIDEIEDLQFQISHYSFFQVNSIQTERLYQTVLRFINPTKDDIVVDGYCGVGTISLYVARHVKKVIGIEIVPEAIQDANANAKRNAIGNVEFVVGKVEEELMTYLNQTSPTALILDPPRKGLDPEVITAILKTTIPTIVYVSCDVATLARDLERLVTEYDVKRIATVDMFAHTCDIETVALLKRK